MTPADKAHAEDRPQLVVRHKAILTIAIMTAMVMQVLDTTVANVALPRMQSSLGATQESISWVLTSYILATAVMIPLAGWLSSRFGTRNLLLVSLVMFVGASALCGLAANLTSMVLFRVAQGVGGAFLAPLAQTIMLDINKPSDQAKAMSIYGMGIMVGPIIGPMLGGYLTENLDWRWVFFINVPIGVACISTLWFLLPHPPRIARRIDIWGWGLAAVAVSTLQLLLDRGQTVDWFSATESWIYLGLTISAFWMLGVHTFTSRNPIFSRDLLKDRNFVAGMFFMLITGLVMMAVMALLPLMMQTIYGYPVIDSGEIMASRGIGMLITMALAGRIIRRVDARMLVAFGFMIVAFTLWEMTGWTVEMGAGPIIRTGFIQGLGMGFIFLPLNVISFTTLPPILRTEASALINLSRNIGSSVGIAAVTVLLARSVQINHSDLSEKLTPANLPMDPSQLGAYGRLGDVGITMLDNIVNQQAIMIAYINDFKFMMIVCLLALPALFLVQKPQRPREGEHVEAMME
ncbi:DHA2 family efflux MFS transporter permease subunit [Sphingobium subterraneum]|uniref:DHA2 family multidrug resistance protein n=1 Tax=Sphingobium subterraneum TaxID=627688 RepID=A0A841J7J4_9SPHN|nr:DHA2 family efflux MFS transporter permease subunit [Sphingobium subterraneum]MBB6124528.1 DHA2 family multidrug resistance protein [Sphingobium subterraneum]